MTDACVNCRFFYIGTTKAFPESDGMCRRYAPSGPVVGCHNNGWQVFPPMMAHHWCGDHSPAPVLAKAEKAAA